MRISDWSSDVCSSDLWSEHNRTDIRHPLSAALPRWLGRQLDMPDQPIPGDNNMPHVASPGFGASEHLDVSPGHEADAILNMPGGQRDRKHAVQGKRVSVRVDRGGRRIIKKKNK